MYVDEPFGVDLKNTVYALDSTTIDLCLGVFPWAPFRSTKAAIKLHTLIDLRGNIPSFVHISDGKLHDVNVLDELLPELGAFYVMDRGYVDFERLHRLHLAGAFFVTRAKSNLKAKRRYSHAVDRSTGLICDKTITLTVFYSKSGNPDVLRRIRFKTDQGKTLVFLTNNFSLPALTIVDRVQKLLGLTYARRTRPKLQEQAISACLQADSAVFDRPLRDRCQRSSSRLWQSITRARVVQPSRPLQTWHRSVAQRSFGRLATEGSA